MATSFVYILTSSVLEADSVGASSRKSTRCYQDYTTAKEAVNRSVSFLLESKGECINYTGKDVASLIYPDGTIHHMTIERKPLL